MIFLCFFFFQAEDGIRDTSVTGVQTCALPIFEVDAAAGLPQWTIVGLAASAVKESRERVGAALVNSGFQVPPRRITVNLRSEERRVGKECRYRREPHQWKQKTSEVNPESIKSA